MTQTMIAEREFRGHWWTLVQLTKENGRHVFRLDDLKTDHTQQVTLAEDLTAVFERKLAKDVQAWASARLLEYVMVNDLKY